MQRTSRVWKRVAFVTLLALGSGIVYAQSPAAPMYGRAFLADPVGITEHRCRPRGVGKPPGVEMGRGVGPHRV